MRIAVYVLLGCASGCAAAPASGGAETAQDGWIDAGGSRPAAPVRPHPPAAAFNLGSTLAGLHEAAAIERSEHLSQDLPAGVLVNEKATRAYARAGGGSRAPAGAIVVEALRDGSRVVAYLVMRKPEPGFDAAGDDWEYLSIDAATGHAESRATELCDRCHADAPGDRLFGAPSGPQ